MEAVEMMEGLRYCPRCGAEGLRPLPDGKALACGGCGYRHFFNPVLAVAVLIEDAEGRLLLIRRRRDPGKGMLAFPGGFADAGECAETAARREIREEVNLELGELRYVTSFPNRYPYQGLIYSTADLFFAAAALSLAPVEALDDVEEVLFLRPEEIDPEELAFGSMREALRRYLT